MKSDYGSYGFQFINDLENPVVQMNGVGLESRSENYYFDNRERRMGGYLFQYTLEGHGILEQNGQKFDVKKGQGFFVSIPGPEQYYLPEQPGENGWQFYFLLFGGSGVEPYFRYITERAGNLLTLPPSASSIRLLGGIYRQARQGRIDRPFLASELAFQFLCHLCSDIVEDGRELSPRIAAAAGLIEQEYATIESIALLADRLGVSASHLSREFFRETGVTIIAHLIRTRLQHSLELLRETSLPIDEIARRCGFSNGNYFSKVFRRQIGVAPNQFRKDPELLAYRNFIL